MCKWNYRRIYVRYHRINFLILVRMGRNMLQTYCTWPINPETGCVGGLISVFRVVYCLQCSGIGSRPSLPLYQNQHTNTCCFHLIAWRRMQHFPRNTGKFIPKYTESRFRKNKMFTAVMFWTSLNISYIGSSTLEFLNSSACGYCGSQGKTMARLFPHHPNFLIDTRSRGHFTPSLTPYKQPMYVLYNCLKSI